MRNACWHVGVEDGILFQDLMLLEVKMEGQLHYSTFYRDSEVCGALFHSFLDYNSEIYWEDKKYKIAFW